MTVRRIIAALAASLLCILGLLSAPAQAVTQPFPVKLHAVNKSGSEYACAQGWGFFDGPVDTASITAMVGWKINAVRIPLNQDCWLSLHGVNPTYSGANYRNAIQGYVTRLHAQGLYVILDLHWSSHNGTLALGQDLMADKTNSVAFWKSVATAYKADPKAAFDLYNEPHSISWQVWKNGDAGVTYAGMNQLIAAVRSTGATNWVIASGLDWGNDLRSWLAYKPTDATGHLAAGAHIYNFNRCVTSTCWNTELKPVLAAVPLFITELGENDCLSAFSTGLLNWGLGANVAGFSPWAWNASMSCTGGPSLITSSTGTPTTYGAGVKTWYVAHP
jgi:hypothetical protein